MRLRQSRQLSFLVLVGVSCRPLLLPLDVCVDGPDHGAEACLPLCCTVELLTEGLDVQVWLVAVLLHRLCAWLRLLAPPA